MKINILKNFCIDIHEYKHDAGWLVSTGIPEELLDRNINIKLEYWAFDKNFDCHEKTQLITIKASFFLDEMLKDLIEQVRVIMEKDDCGLYFIDHRFLESLELDTDTLVATTLWGS